MHACMYRYILRSMTDQATGVRYISSLNSLFQDVNAVKYTLSVQGQNDPQNSPLIVTDEKLMKQLNARLSAVEKDVKTIKDAVDNVSLEEKLGRAIENIENKLEKLADFIYSQREPVYYTNTEVRMGNFKIVNYSYSLAKN